MDNSALSMLKSEINKDVLIRILELENRIGVLENQQSKSDVWLSKIEVTEQYQISERTIYRNMKDGSFIWRKPKGGSRQILKSSIIQCSNLKQ